MEQEKDDMSPQSTEGITGTTVLLKKEYKEDKSHALGNGFFIEPDKIATNVHVLAGASTITVHCVETETTYTIEGIIAFDDINDLAVLKVAEEGTPFPLGNSKKVRKRQHACLLGHRNGKTDRLEGTVFSIQNSGKHIIVEFNIADGQGYSGSPLLNTKGEVIAIVRSGDPPVENGEPIKSRNIASNLLKNLLNETDEVESLDAWQKRPRIYAYVKSYDAYLSCEHGDIKEAIARYDDTIRLNPDLADVYRNRASVMYSLEKRDEYLLNTLSAYKLNRERFSLTRFGLFFSWHLRFIRFSIVLGFQKLIRKLVGENSWFEVHAQVRFRLAKSKIAKGKISDVLNIYQAIIDDFTEVINSKPREEKRKYLYAARNSYKEAIVNLSEVINQKPKRAVSYYHRGKAKYIFGEFESQHKNLKVTKKLFQGTINDYSEAINRKLKGLYIYNHIGQARHQLAQLESQQGNTEAALTLYQNVISDSDEAIQSEMECDACRSAIHHNRGAAKAALEDYDGAIEDYDMSIKINPKYAKAYYNRGKAKQALEQHEAAEADFAKAKELDSNIEE